MQDRNDAYTQLFHEGNRDVQIMGVTFAKRGGNISDRHVQRYRQMMTEWAQDGIFEEDVTVTERGMLLCITGYVGLFSKRFSETRCLCSFVQETACSENISRANMEFSSTTQLRMQVWHVVPSVRHLPLMSCNSV
jgi:hypothetical protein